MKCARTTCTKKARSRGLCIHHNRSGGFVDAAPVVERYWLLRERGLSTAAIARLSGVHRDTLAKMGTWAEGRVRAETAERVMSVRVPATWVQSQARVSAVGTVRRIQALACLGHSLGAIARELGVTQQAVTVLLSRDMVAASTAVRVSALFDRWQFLVGSSSRARNHAKRMGWAPPLAWDCIDDPDETPDVGVQKWVPFMDRYAELKYLNIPKSEMPRWLGIERDSLEKQLSRHGVAS